MLDGFVVREMLRRCNYDSTKLESLMRLLRGKTPTRFNPSHEHTPLVQILWGRYLESGFLSARILELLDEQTIGLVDPDRIRELISTIPARPFPVLATHDCFRVLPHYGNDVRRQYNQILFELAQSNILQFIVRQFAGEDTVVNKIGDGIAAHIQETNYSLS